MPDILIRGMEMPPSCADCPIKGDSYCKLTRRKVKYYHEDRRDDCPIVELPQKTIETNLFDIEEVHPNCTVQILKNSVTGEVSVGWWPNDNKPIGTKEGN